MDENIDLEKDILKPAHKITRELGIIYEYGHYGIHHLLKLHPRYCVITCAIICDHIERILSGIWDGKITILNHNLAFTIIPLLDLRYGPMVFNGYLTDYNSKLYLEFGDRMLDINIDSTDAVISNVGLLVDSYREEQKGASAMLEVRKMAMAIENNRELCITVSQFINLGRSQIWWSDRSARIIRRYSASVEEYQWWCHQEICDIVENMTREPTKKEAEAVML